MAMEVDHLDWCGTGVLETDAVQRNAVSLNKDDVILPGRDVSVTVRQSF